MVNPRVILNLTYEDVSELKEKYNIDDEVIVDDDFKNKFNIRLTDPEDEFTVKLAFELLDFIKDYAYQNKCHIYVVLPDSPALLWVLSEHWPYTLATPLFI